MNFLLPPLNKGRVGVGSKTFVNFLLPPLNKGRVGVKNFTTPARIAIFSNVNWCSIVPKLLGKNYGRTGLPAFS
ncbi:MAG TPA: hypothetical protein DD001_10985 [Microcoleaceae bacterium UBA10368]|nr:hypothetical protein [Microcoleaceae cyanobacterium UBA10368]